MVIWCGRGSMSAVFNSSKHRTSLQRLNLLKLLETLATLYQRYSDVILQRQVGSTFNNQTSKQRRYNVRRFDLKY